MTVLFRRDKAWMLVTVDEIPDPGDPGFCEYCRAPMLPGRRVWLTWHGYEYGEVALHHASCVDRALTCQDCKGTGWKTVADRSVSAFLTGLGPPRARCTSCEGRGFVWAQDKREQR